MGLKNDKCSIRPILMDDLSLLNKWKNDESISCYLGGGYCPVSKDLQIKWMENMIDTSLFSTNKRYIIETNDNNSIGLVGLYNINWIHRNAEVGLYVGEKDFQGKGFASSAFCLLKDYAKNYLNLLKLKIFVVEDNEGAILFWKKNGFKECGKLINERFINGKFCNLLIMELFL